MKKRKKESLKEKTKLDKIVPVEYHPNCGYPMNSAIHLPITYRAAKNQFLRLISIIKNVKIKENIFKNSSTKEWEHHF